MVDPLSVNTDDRKPHVRSVADPLSVNMDEGKPHVRTVVDPLFAHCVDKFYQQKEQHLMEP